MKEKYYGVLKEREKPRFTKINDDDDDDEGRILTRCDGE
jgi:hypothetical protein